MIDTLLFVAVFVPTFLAIRFLILTLTRTKKPASPEPAPSPSVRTLLLVIPSDDVLTDGVKSTLIDMWGDLPASELSSKLVVDMAFEFKVTFPDVDDESRLKIAKAVHAALADDTPKRTEKPDAEMKPKSNGSRAQLEELAQPTKQVTGTNMTVRGGIYRTLMVTGTNAMLRDAIVLERCSVQGTNARGRIFAAPGATVDVVGTNADVRVVQLPWDELVERAATLRRTA